MVQGVVAIVLAVAVCILVSIYSAWSVLEPWEVGLDYSTITQSIGEEAWMSGRHYIGVGHKFIRVNSTVTTVQFTHDFRTITRGPLRSRTKDGLEVRLELSFQYKVVPEKLYKMYTTYGPDYHETFVKMSVDLLTAAATKHNAREFFVNRTMIGNMLEATMRQHFQQKAMVDIPMFQFQVVSLPTEFENAIKATQVAEQKIKLVKQEQNTRMVEYQTSVIQADRYTQVREQEAQAIVQSIQARNDADIASFNASQMKAVPAFKQMLALFNNDGDALVDYMKVRAVRDHPASQSIVGIRDTGLSSTRADVTV